MHKATKITTYRWQHKISVTRYYNANVCVYVRMHVPFLFFSSSFHCVTQLLSYKIPIQCPVLSSQHSTEMLTLSEADKYIYFRRTLIYLHWKDEQQVEKLFLVLEAEHWAIHMKINEGLPWKLSAEGSEWSE